ncbi:MAG: hypothetical protein HY720_08730 [Planctomycetes bacterium]|nr:hypothetical protein [Planctomycetota bacterium]
MMRGRSLIVLLAVLPVRAAWAGEVAVSLENGTDPSLGADGADVSIAIPVAKAGPGEEPWRLEKRRIESGRPALFEVDSALAGTKIDVSVASKGGNFFFAGAIEVGKEPAPLKVYEPTEDRAHFRVVQHYVQIQAGESELHVHETVYVANSSDRAYIGETIPGVEIQATLVVALPERAESFSFEPSGNLSARGFATAGTYRVSDTAIPPGKHKFEYSYHVPLSGPGEEFVKEILAETDFLMLIAPEGQGLDFDVEGLTGRRVEDPHSGGTVLVFEGEALARGTRLTVEVRPAKEEGDEEEQSRDRTSLPWILMGVVLGTSLAVAAVRRPRGGGPAAQAPNPMREHLIDEIARLDLALDRREIGSEYHQRQREFLKKRLLEVG